MELFLHLIKAVSVFLVVAYLFCKSPWFKPLTTDSITARDKVYLYIFFSTISILGTYLGLPINDAVANTRAIGPVLAGIIGGPLLGTIVGFTGGMHRYVFGGFTALSCGLSTTVEGTIGGLVYLYRRRTRQAEPIFDPKVAFATTFVAEIVQMFIILAISRPFSDALALVKIIAVPMIAMSSTGAALFMSIIRDQKNIHDRVAASSSVKAFKIAERTLKILSSGINPVTAKSVAKIIQEETGVSAVAITDNERVIAFIGSGSDHHIPDMPIASPITRAAIAENRVIFLDGRNDLYTCNLSDKCPLNSVLVVPIQIDNEIIGTIKLYETKGKRFLNINKTLGEGIANLLSNQLLFYQYQQQKNLLVTAELKLLQAQMNPHFLFNSLNTIIAIIRNDGARARKLLIDLSNLLRKSLKRSNSLSTLEEELDQVNSYLRIEQARFEDRMTVEMDIDPSLRKMMIPTFTLQPLIENAIRHGISNMLEPGTVKVRVCRNNGFALIEIEDNAGTYHERELRDGLGIKIVDKRIKNLFGNHFGVRVFCEPAERTRVSIQIPLEAHSS